MKATKTKKRKHHLRLAINYQLEERVLLAGDLVANWRADDLQSDLGADGQVSSWVDSVNGIAATASGTPQLSTDAFGSRPGIQFDASDGADFFTVAKEQNPLSGAADFTVVVVFSTTSDALQGNSTNWYDNTGLIDSNNLGFAKDWGMTIDSNGIIAAGLGRGGFQPSSTLTSEQLMTNDGKVHVATVTRSSNVLSIYVDDQPVSVLADADDQPRDELQVVFGALSTGQNAFTGNFSQIQMYNGALNENEVAANYESIISPRANGDFYFVTAGETVEINAPGGVLANDTDITTTSLTAELLGAPEKGSVNLSEDGSFVYTPSADFNAGRDSFSYRTLDGTETSNEATVTLVINSESDQQKVTINEIHSNPDIDTELVEFVELYNPGEVPVLLEGWFFDGGVDYVFPESASIEAGGFYVITENSDAFAEKFGSDADGQWVGKLRNSGETLQLRSGQQSLIDRVDFAEGFPWPTVGDEPGYSMELINSSLDNQLGGSWRSSIGNQTIFATGEPWHYFKGTEEPSAGTSAWRQVDFDDANWSVGSAPIGFSSREPIATDLDDMRNNYSSVYFRKAFEVADVNSLSSLSIRASFDDGVNIWINGQHVASHNTLDTEQPFDAVATASNRFGTPVEFVVDNARDLLVSGKNVIAVQLLNQSLANSDALFDAELLDLSQNAPGPSPGSVNSIHADEAPPQIRQVDHFPLQPTSNEDVTITAKATDPDGVASMTLEYQNVAPGSYIRLHDTEFATNWTALEMKDDGTSGDVTANDSIYTVVLPADLHQHRHLMRYRIHAVDSLGTEILVPYADDPAPNFAYFVYDGIPEWTAADRPGRTDLVTFSADQMSHLQTYHLIADATDVQNSQFNGSFEEARFNGTMVYNGKVYDHIEFRVRGEFSTYQSGKNKWKFFFNRSHELEAEDNFGRAYDSTRRVLNFSSTATPWVLMNRGMAGLGEATAYELYDLAGMPSPNTDFVHFRVIDDEQEAPEDQYSGDVWGLYLALEQPDGRFLDERNLPNGTTYKVESSQGDIKNQGPTQPDARRDFSSFMSSANRRSTPEEWWRENVDLDAYFSFRAVNRAVNNMDIRDGWNHYLYHNPDTNKWTVIPWDLDMLYVPSTHWSGVIRLENMLRIAALEIEYQNRARELQDLLFSTDQVGQLVDELAGIVNPPALERTMVDADRFMWNYNRRSINGHRGAFDRQTADYDFARGRDGDRTMISGDHEGFAQWIKDFISPAPGGGSTPASYGADFVDREARDSDIPATPVITYSGADGFTVDQLSFSAQPFSDPQGDDSFGAMKWRIAEVTDVNAPSYDPTRPAHFEVDALWESEVFTEFQSDITIPTGVASPGHAYRVRARMMDNTGRWGHWSDPIHFIAGVSDSTQLVESLRISEVHYNPSDPTPAEIAAGHTDNNSFEFVELTNIGAETLNLGAVEFTQTTLENATNGILFDFASSPIQTLEPGRRIVVVEDLEAFEARYGSELPIAGQWSGGLSNNSEQITLQVDGITIQQFTYDDEWHPTTDGDGYSLDAVNLSNPDLSAWNQKEGWRPSSQIGGSPGAGGVVAGDSNRDGRFDSSDLVHVFAIGEYEDNIPSNSTFEDGDWDGDGDFTSSDLVFVFQQNTYVADARLNTILVARSLFSDNDDALRKRLRRDAVDAVFLPVTVSEID